MKSKKPSGLASRNDLRRPVAIFVVTPEQLSRLRTPFLRKWFLMSCEACFVVQPTLVGDPAEKLRAIGLTPEFIPMLNAWAVVISNPHIPLDEAGAVIGEKLGADERFRGWADNVSYKDYLFK